MVKEFVTVAKSYNRYLITLYNSLYNRVCIVYVHSSVKEIAHLQENKKFKIVIKVV